MDRFQVYKDIEARTNGEIYIGVVGPVRTGKSTFIKRFMDVLVLPEMEDEHARMRTQDELPQSASGRTIMTTEPKFVPKEAAKIRLADDVDVKVRLIGLRRLYGRRCCRLYGRGFPETGENTVVCL